MTGHLTRIAQADIVKDILENESVDCWESAEWPLYASHGWLPICYPQLLSCLTYATPPPQLTPPHLCATCQYFLLTPTFSWIVFIVPHYDKYSVYEISTLSMWNSLWYVCIINILNTYHSPHVVFLCPQLPMCGCLPPHPPPPTSPPPHPQTHSHEGWHLTECFGRWHLYIWHS